ncbi:MAG: hypothetical protein OXC46_08270 [Thaumarchaeota archaeon]|nr:hypothetical protein [Nitrososphaerota archaeon]
MESSPNLVLGWTKVAKGCIISTTPNTARVTPYCHTSKFILKLLKNPKYIKFVI